MSLKRSRSDYDQSADSPVHVHYGTVLPPADSQTRDDGSYVPLWKQEVTDERGRKRLHGAFTGGFSAGYFNTVGSKEGWTPASFKSSRNARAKPSRIRPEDYMDDEDLREAEEARKIETKRDFSGIGGDLREPSKHGDMSGLIDLLISTIHETMGVKLLKKMGWKEGQGVGARVKRRARDIDTSPTIPLEHEEQDDDSRVYFFAPNNPPLVTFRRNRGFQGLEHVSEPLNDHGYRNVTPPMPGGSVKKSRGGAFGVGVLNDDGDNEDPYEIRPKSSLNRTVSEDKKSRKPLKKPAIPQKHTFISKKANAAKADATARRCHDGRLALPGFVLSLQPVGQGQPVFNFPSIPPDWTALHKDPSLSAPHDRQQRTVPPAKLDPHARGTILGEVSLPGKSVFDYIAPSTRNRIAVMTGRQDLPPGLGEAPPSGITSVASLADLVPRMDKDIAISALSGGFMPYADDPEKRARYRSFLEFQAGMRTGLPDRKYGMNTQDWAKEMNEFLGAARIFKPLTGMIATRFTSSTRQSDFQGDASDASHRLEPSVENSTEAAAKMSMYGPLTRNVVDFTPCRLLCKRFNVSYAGPTGGSGEDLGTNGRGTAHDDSMAPKMLISPADMSEIAREMSHSNGSPKEQYEPSDRDASIDTEHNDALEGERAAEEVFEAIFGSGDDD